MARPMEKWYIDKVKLSDGFAYMVEHYVGGEEGHVLFDDYPTEQEAIEAALILNKAGITYYWACNGDDNYVIDINWNGNEPWNFQLPQTMSP